MDASFFKLRMVPRGVKGNNKISSRVIDFWGEGKNLIFIHTRGDNLTIVREFERGGSATSPAKSDRQFLGPPGSGGGMTQ